MGVRENKKFVAKSKLFDEFKDFQEPHRSLVHLRRAVYQRSDLHRRQKHRVRPFWHHTPLFALAIRYTEILIVLFGS